MNNLRLKFHSANDPWALIESPIWYMGVKIDGHGMWGEYDGIGIRFHNSEGGPVGKSFNPQIADDMRWLAAYNDRPFCIRGELDRGNAKFNTAIFRVWDILSTSRFAARHYQLRQMIERAPALSAVVFHEFSIDPEEKAKIFLAARDDMREGVVFYHADSFLEFGKRTRQVLKYKFKDTADCYVLSVTSTVIDVNGYSHGVAQVAVMDNGNLIYAGDIHLRENILSVLEVGDILEVEYLHFDKSFVQPIAQRKRDDKHGLSDVTDVSQLRRRGT